MRKRFVKCKISRSDQKKVQYLTRSRAGIFLFSYFQQNFRFAHGVYMRAMLAGHETKKKTPIKKAKNKPHIINILEVKNYYKTILNSLSNESQSCI